MYAVILAFHNILRWVVVILAVLALARSYRGWLGKGAWTELDRKVGVFFAAAMDTQLLLGLILYLFLSNFAIKAILNQGMAFVMRTAQYRFFALEHAFYMALAIVFAHLGSALPKKVEDAVSKHQRAAIFFTLAVLALILGMPWTRPLFPGL